MIDFSTTIAFGLVRRLATAGTNTPSLYLLICDPGATRVIEADIAAEVEVQLGVRLRVFTASKMLHDGLDELFTPSSNMPVTLITFDCWFPKLATALDRNVALLTRNGATFLAANQDISGRLLSASPNLRNRLTDVLEIQLDESFGGAMA
jgi:hypothetical protein